MLESALPRVGSIATATPELQLSFSEVIVPMLSPVTLNDAHGGRIVYHVDDLETWSQNTIRQSTSDPGGE